MKQEEAQAKLDIIRKNLQGYISAGTHSKCWIRVGRKSSEIISRIDAAQAHLKKYPGRKAEEANREQDEFPVVNNRRTALDGDEDDWHRETMALYRPIEPLMEELIVGAPIACPGERSNSSQQFEAKMTALGYVWEAQHQPYDGNICGKGTRDGVLLGIKLWAQDRKGPSVRNMVFLNFL
ncbi:hypothetical protein BJ322DRAFT_1197422 [Thelephora terrestris]|uniref:Uncharacterized protein n=1 Tax=Thelephora terrestris TaxID=56493 RepID=A0A9P6HDS6_9AGAM|nr:hypothetical protein BJ322DRAFT_1197422 [Thelephora terrestris]